MRNIALYLRYDGTKYHGWQEQKDDITVQATLQRALSRICGHPVKAVWLRPDGCRRPRRTLLRQLQDGHPDSGGQAAPGGQHAPAAGHRRHARRRRAGGFSTPSCRAGRRSILIEYTTPACATRFNADRAYFYPVPLDEGVMAEAARRFVGTHDFAAVPLRGDGDEDHRPDGPTGSRSTETDSSSSCASAPTGSCNNMARAMSGTLIYASDGKINPSDIPALLEDAGQAGCSGPTVPPCGLYLTRIWYDGRRRRDDGGRLRALRPRKR